MHPPFPEAAAPAPPLPEILRSRGLGLRPAGEGDLSFLRALFGGFRAMEMAFVPWSAAQKTSFLDDQFRLQHLHFTRFFPKADFWIVTRTEPLGVPQAIGRLYLDRTARPWRIVDIGFAPEARGSGIGAALIEWIQAAAGRDGVALSVAHNNARAAALYARLGFTAFGTPDQTHREMRWAPGPS